jgi:hypothetical protein
VQRIGYISAMHLLWYAETPTRRSRQIAADVVAALALLCCLWIGSSVHDLTDNLAAPGRSLEAGGASLAQRMTDAGNAVSDAPFIGDSLRQPFDQASSAGRSIEQAGAKQQQVVHTLALTLGWVTGGVPGLAVLALWLPKRLRFARRAAHAQRLVGGGAGLDVFALRALARQPIAELSRLSSDPAAGWRNRDPAMIEALAALELRHLGLRPKQGAAGR